MSHELREIIKMVFLISALGWFFASRSNNIYVLAAILIITVLIPRFLPKKKQKSKKTKTTEKVQSNVFDITKVTINDIDNMDKDGQQFESYLFVLLTALGYKHTYQTKKKGDFGADLIFTDRNEQRTVVQAKNYTGETSLGNRDIQRTYGSIPFYNAHRAIVITSAKIITNQAEIQASACNITIIARSDLRDIIKYFRQGQHSKIQDILEARPIQKIYKPRDYIDPPTITKTKISSGDYYYKFPINNKKSS